MKIYAVGVLFLDLSDNPRKVIKDSRLWALYENFEDAEESILKNLGDIFESYYNVACIEEYKLINFSKRYEDNKLLNNVFHLDYQVPKQWWYQVTDQSADGPIITNLGSQNPKGLENTTSIWIG